MVRTPDGRALGWAQWGPVQGRPVVFCSGAGMGRGLGFGADVLDRLDTRLICVDRPGVGASDPAPGRTLNDWAADVDALAAQLGLSGFGVVGFSNGGPFALACAALGGADAVAVVSGTDELAHPRFTGLLDPDVLALVRHAATDPDGFEEAFTETNADTMWRVVMETASETDRALYADPMFERPYRRALAEGFTQGGAGYARDLVLAFRRWTFDPGEITVPVDLWYGGRDTSAVHSPDHGAGLAEIIPTARRHLLPHAGAALPWTHAEEILAALARRSRP
ncbi:alpha/beta hydrolase [Marinactinospora endophytica]